MRTTGLLLAVIALMACAAQPQEAASGAGKALFDRHCGACHAPGVGTPGTQRLEWSKGAAFAVLEERSDLNADYVRAIVRNGLIEMPPFRPTEITARELGVLAAYLAKTPR
jgi:mono/diheme cytochrome c family protein